ncbi:hypothetical protein F9K88_07335 [Brucella intermedia]|uniref:Uncharacterized protein n=1 Tax=Brucella daejeonensis TaxID=659015 RepID=A0A7W9AUC6_9HYPH|nr:MULTISPECIES: hypothetical protein [Brucella]KAB2712764.1 hypothetical protein F9K88_07335 [Brucella intermedia]MBB5700691.1 hypothetical protein [Brucella daejeonensis]MCH6206511.1 hypothetical protein [Brucella ciceri]MCO7728950.1 hypothetical protein [Brucella intermedia]NKB79389.1 hypothetical protein [Brucella daejeonensis]
MSKITVVIEYDTDAAVAQVQYGGKTQEWRDAKLTFAQGITETRDGYLIRRERDGTVSMLLTGITT